MKNKIIKHTW